MSKLEKLRDLLPWKRKGYKVLDKFNTKDPHEGDQKVLAQMLEHGADLKRERHVVHYLYFPNNAARATAQDKLNQQGYETRPGVDYGDVRPKSLIAERTGIVNDDVVGKERELLTNIAEAGYGEYDGWEAALD